MERRLLKFKYGFASDTDSRKCLVKYELERADGEYDLFTFECNDEPHPDLNFKLQGMAKHLIEICELPSDRVVTVNSVTCTHKDMDGQTVHGLVISGTRALNTSDAPMCLNSPHKTNVPYAEDQDASDKNLSGTCLSDLALLADEVFAYVDGKRSQGEFDFGNGDGAPKAA
jgi:hypothetical protein